ncbi:hypothetical protein FHX42_000673 [Saccharopolyspora lacisalsi]|uniref:DUF1326 domain-containing protein n=1 Tax=Halosaccharopolyspora lacisalsi TaxID=1000566 RepID=A0A839DPD1_9PSEU|nr:DUF1326 domain-containing protein [Halosaccharopolyspora lacisalsi]MBA8823344.1 hypothetical protein [Halosaccharopolyspora lacisalsi]
MTTSTVQKWHLKGDWFDACKCAIPCPCSFAQPPTYGDCEGILLWHVREGRYGDTRLDGLNVVMLASFTGNVWSGEHTDPYAAVFVDEHADDDQRGALRAVFSGDAGGWPARFGEMFRPEMRGMEFAPIEATIDDELATWSVRVPDRAEATVEALTGPTTAEGERVQVHNLPGAEVGPGQGPSTWGKAVTNRADAFGFRWDRSGYSSKLIPFEWSGPDGT